MSNNLTVQLMEQQKELLLRQQQLLQSQTDWAQTMLQIINYEIQRKQQKTLTTMRLVK